MGLLVRLLRAIPPRPCPRQRLTAPVHAYPPIVVTLAVAENPYEAAQLFLARNELPPSYVDQVVQFIEKNTAGATLGSGGNLDPYTGASSYKSTPSMNAQNGSGPTGAGAGAGFSGDPWGPSSASVSASSGATANAASAKARLLPLVSVWRTAQDSRELAANEWRG